jgi:ribonuclease HI
MTIQNNTFFVKNYLTINTDISFYSKKKKTRKYFKQLEKNLSSWSFYVRYGNVKIEKTGLFSIENENSQIAELRAIGVACYFILKRKIDLKIEKIIINTDCLTNITLLNDIFINSNFNIKNNAYCEKSINLIKELKEKLNCSVEVRKVKAHSNGKLSKEYVNNLIDFRARDLAFRELKKLTKVK